MAITITKQPYRYAPTQNAMIFEFETDNTNTLYFNVIVKEANTNKILSKNNVFIAPNGEKKYIDISKTLDNLVSTPIDNSTNLFKNLGGTLGYYLEVQGISATGQITDEKITTPITYAFNGKLNEFDLYNNVINDYYISTGFVGKFLTDRPKASYLHYSANEHLYFLADDQSGIYQIKIEYQYFNNTVNTFSLPISTNGELLHRINLSPKNLDDQIGLNLFSLKNFKVWLEDINGNKITEVRQYNIVNYKCGISVCNLNWINQYGGLSSNAFIAPKETKQVTRTTYDTNGYLNRNYGVYTPTQTILKNDINNQYSILSQNLTDEEYDVITNIINSRNVYTQLVDGDLYPINLNTTSLQVLQKKYTKKQNRIELSFSSNTNLKLVEFQVADAVLKDGFNYNFDIIL
ncbi:hypothetical protein [Sphingobacterium multivorum]|uniref:hypothetical protein n=1 Tax=Sphingobacterium multivorum TaxID=28454 RepID=UPI0028ABCBFB|nr:hypothetical protein [Sphingobacterium multivorum]